MSDFRTLRTAIVVNLAAGILAALTCSAQTAPAGSAAPVFKLEKGTALVAELTNGLNSKKAKSGAKVKATIIQDVLAHGAIIVRRDSKLVGHVTEVKASRKDDRESRLGIVFDRVILKGGRRRRAVAAGISFGQTERDDTSFADGGFAVQQHATAHRYCANFGELSTVNHFVQHYFIARNRHNRPCASSQ